MRLYWTPEAQQRLQDIEAYLAEEAVEIAERTISRLVMRAEQLLDYPSLGHRLKDYPQSGLLEILERPYRIIYQNTGEQIEIITVLHYRQLIPRSMGLPQKTR